LTAKFSLSQTEAQLPTCKIQIMRLKIGFIGLGSLGTPIALNIASSGHDLYVYNRTSGKAGPLSDKGAVVCPSVASLAASCRLVFSIVSDDAALRSVVQSGLLELLQPGSIHVSMSTISPQTAKDLFEQHRAKGQHYLAAPVFGRPEAATAKKLNFVVSGEPQIRKQVEPYLTDCGALGIWDFGEDITAANTVKLCGNFLIAAALEVIGESISLAQNSGVDAHKMWAMLSQTLFNSPVYQNYSNIILQQKFSPAAFSAKLGLKDLNLVLDQAARVDQYLPLAALLQKNMLALVEGGKPEVDWSAVWMGPKNRQENAETAVF
jgi:3-hydroxyisobutyrate dehydrogenase-like beta-hydroxyacid dehydrogenase